MSARTFGWTINAYILAVNLHGHRLGGLAPARLSILRRAVGVHRVLVAPRTVRSRRHPQYPSASRRQPHLGHFLVRPVYQGIRASADGRDLESVVRDRPR